MTQQARVIREMLEEIENNEARMRRLLESAESEIGRLCSIIRENEMDLANKDIAIAKLLEENRKLREEQPVGIYCLTCKEKLIGSEKGKKYCNRCYREWHERNGTWRSGTWRSQEERAKED